MAISTHGVKLGYKAKDAQSTVKYTYVAIKSFPSLDGEKSSLETTTLSDSAKTFIEGIMQTPDNFAFTTNWNQDLYKTLRNYGEAQCILAYSDESNWTWKGMISASTNEGGVDEVVGMTINIKPTTAMTFAETLPSDAK